VEDPEWAFTWAFTAVEDPRVGLFRHFSIRFDSSALVHFVAPQQSWGLLHGQAIHMHQFDALFVHS
jgi:hypothetical protein